MTMSEKVYIKFDDIDRHGEGCDCGSCNSQGKSYGYGIYPQDSTEVLARVYACSEFSAEYNATKLCEKQGLIIVDMPDDL
jgi:hypothetical protein